jgi:hypothetical protein
MLDRGPDYPPSWRGRPPAMLDADVPVWHRYLDRHADEFARFWYNVRITSDDLAARFPDAQDRAIAEALLPKRIDAVGERPDALWIIEVAAVIGLRSIGQALTYAALWRAERPEDAARLRAVLVCGQCGADEQAGARAAGVQVIDVAD